MPFWSLPCSPTTRSPSLYCYIELCDSGVNQEMLNLMYSHILSAKAKQSQAKRELGSCDVRCPHVGFWV